MPMASNPSERMTLLSVKDADPFGFYETLRAHGPLVRDDVMNAWLVVYACSIPPLCACGALIHRETQ